MDERGVSAWPYLSARPPIGFAHRGGNEKAPENSFEAFCHAVELGYTYLETDVHLSADGVLVAVHDADLTRVSGAEVAIAERTWDELRCVDLGDGCRIPSMAELLTSFPGVRFNIEPKRDEAVDPLVALIREHRAEHRVCIGSFSSRRVRRVRRSFGGQVCTSPGPSGLAAIALHFLLPAAAARRLPTLPRHGAVQIPNEFGGRRLGRGLIRRFQERGYQVHVWTINDPDEMHRLLDAGVDGVMSDRASVLRQVLIERGHWEHRAEEPA